MDFNDLLNTGISILKDKIGENNPQIEEALNSIFGGEDGKIDLSNIFSKLEDANLGEIISSWISSGENAPIDTDNLKNLLGEEKISEFAQKLGIDIDSATETLKDLLPQVIDKATPEGDSILDQIGGIDGIINMAKKFF